MGIVAAVVCGGRLLSLLLHGRFVDLDGFLAVLGRVVDVAGFLGEDLEEAEVDGLYERVISRCACLL
jgi:hypothetical protein